MPYIDTIGIIGTIILSLSSIPQVIESIKTGKTLVNSLMLWLWLIGVILVLIYASFKLKDVIMCINYSSSIIFLFIMLKYKYFPRK